MALIETRKMGTPPWTFPQDLGALDRYLDERRRHHEAVDLVLLDSLSAYVPRIEQPEKAAEALEGLMMLGIEFNCSVSFVHHFLKAGGRSIDAAIGGATQVQRIARTIHLFGEEPVDIIARLLGREGEPEFGARVLANHKLNVAARPPSLRFGIEIRSLPTVEQVPVLRLLGECEHDDEAVFTQARKPAQAEPATEVDGAVEWMLHFLLGQHAYACPTKQLVAEGRDAGFSERTLERARAKARIVRVPPSKVRQRLGEEAYAALGEEEQRSWWVALPDFIPPPEEWKG